MEAVKIEPIIKDPRQQKALLYEIQACKCSLCQLSFTIDMLTIDHIVPKAIAKILGWSNARINKMSNKQLLCNPCHRYKDKDVKWEARRMRASRGL